jgi:hypothetical protein
MTLILPHASRPKHRGNNRTVTLQDHGLMSRIHRKKRPHCPVPDHLSRGNATKSRLRCAAEHVCAQQKVSMGLFIVAIR